MKHYIEITMNSEDEISSGFILQKVFQRLHPGWVETEKKFGNQLIGISFPEYNLKNFSFGKLLRLHAEDASVLESFEVSRRLHTLREYVQTTTIKETPTRIENYALFKRFQPKNNPLKFALRSKRRLEKWEKEGAQSKIDRFYQRKKETEKINQITLPVKNLPYIIVNSCSTGKRFSLFVQMVKAEKPVPGKPDFTCYGLSRSTPLPIF